MLLCADGPARSIQQLAWPAQPRPVAQLLQVAAWKQPAALSEGSATLDRNAPVLASRHRLCSAADLNGAITGEGGKARDRETQQVAT